MKQPTWSHPVVSRRTAVQAGAIGLLGLGMNHLGGLRSAVAAESPPHSGKAKSCIYIFLSGGLAQQDSFDMKPHAPDTIRGEFSPIATNTPGIEICEHLPLLAQRSHLWSLVRSLTHPTNGHTLGHYFMLTGHSTAPGFKGDRKPRSTDWPSIASIVGDAVPPQSDNLPPAVMLPERLVHWSGGVMPGAYGGMMGRQRDPFIFEATHYGDPFWRGAYPEYTFHQLPKTNPTSDRPKLFQAPSLKLPAELEGKRFGRRLSLLNSIDHQRLALDRSAEGESYDRHRQSAISLLASPEIRRAIDVTSADAKTQDRYGRNSFGWSLLMAYRMVESGVNMVQVNLGNNEGWDTHGEAFWRLKNKLLPPTDRALSALLDDLNNSGLLDSTLIVMGGEFGRTPKLSLLADSYKQPGRDHWGAVQTVFFAGGGTRGGNVIGSSDSQGGYPATDPQKPENMAASIYSALGIPRTAVWTDDLDRPHRIFHGDPIAGLI
jgi:hypothetical protein